MGLDMIPSLKMAARALGGMISGDCIRFPPPGHSKNDRSGAAWFGPQYPDGVYVHTFSPIDDPLPVKDYVLERTGMKRRHRGKPGSTHVGVKRVHAALEK